MRDMKYTDRINRLTGTAEDSWAVYKLARQMIDQGHDVIELAIGEPDVPAPDYLVDTAINALQSGRTTYSTGEGEPGLRCALAKRYTRTTGRQITDDQILCFPGTQTALFAAIHAIAGPGDQILVGDPMYATYDVVFQASGAEVVRIPLRAENGFRMAAEDLRAAVTPRTTAIFINTPHNPTGAVLSLQDLEEIGAVAQEHDLWLLSDEVYDEMLYPGATFHSPLELPELAERTIVVNSISKSHAAPGFRSGWCVGSPSFCQHLLPYSEAMLFGNQPFIADATERAVSAPSPVAQGMAARFAARADRLAARLQGDTNLNVHKPQAGMFALVDVSGTGLSGRDYAFDLLRNGGVGVMPGSSFGPSLENWVRLSLTKEDALFDEACERIVKHAQLCIA
jgi:arginine:pyruvate transaminase